jgi:hypothetical protein
MGWPRRGLLSPGDVEDVARGNRDGESEQLIPVQLCYDRSPNVLE